MPTAPGLPPEALLRLHFQKLGGRGDDANLNTHKKESVEREREHSGVDYMEVAPKAESISPGNPAASAVPASSSMPVSVSFDEEAPALESRKRSITTEGIGTVKSPPVAPMKTVMASSPITAPRPDASPPPAPAAMAPRSPSAMPMPAPSARPSAPTAPPAPPPEPAKSYAASPIPTPKVSSVRPSRPEGDVVSHHAPVSPFAPTVPVEVFDPGPDAFAPAPSKREKATSEPVDAERSMLPFVLITIGVLALLAVFLIWLFS